MSPGSAVQVVLAVSFFVKALVGTIRSLILRDRVAPDHAGARKQAA